MKIRQILIMTIAAGMDFAQALIAKASVAGHCGLNYDSR